MPISKRTRRIFATGLGNRAAANKICDIADAGTTGTAVPAGTRRALTIAIGNAKEADTIADCCETGAAIPANCQTALAVVMGNRGAANELVTAINAIA